MRSGTWKLAAAGLALGLATSASALPPVGKTAPAWTGKTTTGKTLNSSQFKGKVVLLNFFNNY